MCREKQFNTQLCYMPGLYASYKKLKIVLNIKEGAKKTKNGITQGLYEYMHL